MITDRDGNLYIADRPNGRIRRIDQFGIMTTVAGAGSYWTPPTSTPPDDVVRNGDGGLAINAILGAIKDLAFDAAGNLYVNEYAGCIRRIDHQTKIITSAVGQCFGSRQPNADGAPPKYAISAETMAVDGPGNIYFDDGCKIRRADHVTGILTTVVGDGGCASYGDNGLAINATMGRARKIVLDKNGNLYITEDAFGDVRRVDAATGIIRRIYLGRPVSMAADDFDNVYLTKAGNDGSNVLRVNALSLDVTVIAGRNREPGYAGDGGPATSALLSEPRTVAVDTKGNLFITNVPSAYEDFSKNIRRVDKATGIITTFAGNGRLLSSGDNGPATIAQLRMPIGIARDKEDNLYVVDSHNNSIRRVDAATGVITAFAGTGMQGTKGNGGLAIKAELFEPTHIALDSVGNIFFVDHGNQIRRIDKATKVIDLFSGDGAWKMAGDNGPAANASHWGIGGIAFDVEDNLYITDEYGGAVRRVDASTGVIKTVLGPGVGINQLDSPTGIAVDKRGNVFFADTRKNRILRFDKVTSEVTLAWSGAGSGRPPIQPYALAMSANDILYFSTSDSVLRYLNLSTKVASVVAGTGESGQFGDGGPALSASLSLPKGLAVGRKGQVFISDTGNFRIRKID